VVRQALLLAPLFLTSFSQAQTVTFTRDVLSYDTSYSFADFNNDGREDLLTRCGNDQVAVALSTADGTYGPPTCYPLPNGQVRDAAVGDFNSDGNLDIMISNAMSTVYEFLNDGKGNFHLARSIAVAGSAHSLATADVNHDGIVDLLYFEDVSQVLHVLFGKPDGTFLVGPTNVFHTSAAGDVIYVGDFDGDGKADVVWQGPFFETDVQVGYGDGQGHFDLRPSFQDTVITESMTWTGTGDQTLLESRLFPKALATLSTSKRSEFSTETAIAPSHPKPSRSLNATADWEWRQPSPTSTVMGSMTLQSLKVPTAMAPHLTH